MKGHYYLMVALPVVALIGFAYYSSLNAGREGGSMPPTKAESVKPQVARTENTSMLAVSAPSALHDVNMTGLYDYGTDPCKADSQNDSTRTACAEETYRESLRQQPVGELLSLWQGMVANADEQSNVVSAILVEKIQQLPDNDPVYTALRDFALTVPDSLTLSSVAILLGKIGTAPVVGIAQDLITQGKLEEGFSVLEGMASTRSIAKWDVGRKQSLPPLGDTLQTAWGNVQGDTQDEYWQRVRLVNVMAVEGRQTDASFLLHNAQNSALSSETRGMLQNAIGKLNNPQLVNYLSQQLYNNKPDEPAFQGSAAALAGMATVDGARALLEWAQTHAADTDVDRVKVWFGQSAGIMQYDSQGKPHNAIKPLAEQASFQSEAVKTAVLAGIAEQERQLSPQLSQAQ